MITFVGDRHGRDQRYAINPAKAIAKLGWAQTTIFKDCILLKLYKQYCINMRITSVMTEEYKLSKAARTMNSRLDKSKLVENEYTPLPIWQDALRKYLEEME